MLQTLQYLISLANGATHVSSELTAPQGPRAPGPRNSMTQRRAPDLQWLQWIASSILPLSSTNTSRAKTCTTKSMKVITLWTWICASHSDSWHNLKYIRYWSLLFHFISQIGRKTWVPLLFQVFSGWWQLRCSWPGHWGTASRGKSWARPMLPVIGVLSVADQWESVNVVFFFVVLQLLVWEWAENGSCVW